MSRFARHIHEEPPPFDPSAVVEPPLVPRRIPNLGHALLFILFAGVLLFCFQVAMVALGYSPITVRAGNISVLHPKLQLATQAITYIATLVTAWLFFPLVWHRGFLSGVRWHWSTARQHAARLISLGLVLGLMSQVVTYFITPPKTLPIDEFFTSASTAWLITLFGTLVAPVFEEVCFRGFLLPACAIAYDWLSLPRTEEARARWQSTTTLSSAALVFAAILSSIFFAMMHFQQDAHLWAAMLVLFSISLVLTFVRIKTDSVAASTLVHAAYNGFVFLTVLIATGGYLHLDRMTR